MAISAKTVSVQPAQENEDDLAAGLNGSRAGLSACGDPVYPQPGPALRLRRPRMTVRFLLVLVALAALLIDAGLIAWRAVTYHDRATEHARYLNSGRSFIYDSGNLRDWHEQMLRKYQMAASRPWLPVVPDPPQPE